MKVLICLAVVVAVACAQGLPPGFNLTQFLISEAIAPGSVVTTNCLPAGSQCSASSSQPCCLSPVFVCQPNNFTTYTTCSVVPPHRVHTPIIRAIMASFGVTTEQPVY